jgi:molecular chaperone GrpE
MSTRDEEDPASGSPVATDPHAEPDGPAVSAPDDAEAQIEALKRERDDLYDRLLRKTAEFDNYRKRLERERREQADQVVTTLLLDLVGVVDDFERALDATPGTNATARTVGASS